MKISVVIPLYNKEKYIARTINSVLNQTVSAAEIIVVDDGSTDNSAREVERIIDNRIHLVRQKNAGEGAARNRGVLEATCDLIAFLDADDEWKPDFLLHIQRLFNNFPDCGMYATSFEIIDPNCNKYYPPIDGVPPAPWIGIIPNLFKMMQFGNSFFPSSVAIPKHVYRELGGFPEGVTQGADRMMWVRMGVNFPIAFSPSPQVIYHSDATNRMSSAYVQEPAAANLIDKMVANHEVPTALLKDVEDFNAYLKIEKAKHRIKAGEPKLARDLLITLFSNRKYRNKAIRWYLGGLIPSRVIKLIIRR